MDIFAKNKLFLKIIVILVLINIFLVSYLWWQIRVDHRRRPLRPDIVKTSSILQDKLHLTEKQFEELKKIREDFFVREQALSSLIKAQRDSMNVVMFSENTDSIFIKNIARRVAENEYRMELYRIEQAKQFQDLCNREQLKTLQEIVIEIRDYFRPGPQTDKHFK